MSMLPQWWRARFLLVELLVAVLLALGFEVRNKWAHQEPFNTDDAYRVLDSLVRLLKAVSAPEAEEVDRAHPVALAAGQRRGKL